MAKPRRGKPKLAACTPDDVFGVLKKLGTFEIRFESAKHTKIIHVPTGEASTIPRHSPINRNLLKDFVEDFLVAKCGFSEEEIYTHLWC